MTDTLGLLQLPVPTPALQPVGDPLRATLASYLQAAIRYYCTDAWQTIGGIALDPCARTETNDPADNTFVTAALPCLALYRDERNRKVTYHGNDIASRESRIVMLWIPPTAVQNDKAKRESFFNAIEGAVIAGLLRGRVPTWVVQGDTDASAHYRGSYVGTQLGLMRPIYGGDMTFDDHTISIEMQGAQPRKYPALRGMITVHEQYVPDATIGTTPIAIVPETSGGPTITVNGGVPWTTLEDVPT